ncbi:helix-turn-helix domain-containing protein [Pendulispora rubella]|uniref:helix-turn-helix domain-containing protein n=1 Tax=Pendulispora rubella TaxID=2741070 RepID=UPI00374E19A3
MPHDVAQAGDATELEDIAAKLLSLPGSLGSKLEAIERAAIAETMRSCGHNKSEAARVLGMDRKALERRWHRFQSEPAFPAAPRTAPEPAPPASQRSG